MADLNINNVINVSIVAPQVGLGEYNTSNLLLITSDIAQSTFPTSGYAAYLDSDSVAKDFLSTTITSKMANAVFSQVPNILAGGGRLIVAKRANANETLAQAIARLTPIVQFTGVISTISETSVNGTAASNANQATQKILGLVSRRATDIAASGYFDTIRSTGNTRTRCLFYDKNATTDESAVLFMAAYFGRALSVNFSSPLSTQTVQGKQLATIPADPSMTQTDLELAKTAGVDIYPSIAGIPSVSSSGANLFFDRVYNFIWFAGAVEVAGFNYLRQTNTKIPQTNEGMEGLAKTFREVCARGVVNGFIAPGKWTSTTIFGSQETFLRAISETGFYVYYLPVENQSQSDRLAREASPVRVAIKEAGAIHSGSIIVNVNA